MAQNIISLNITDADLTAVDEAFAILDQKLAPLVGLSPEVRRGLVKMGDKAEAFCRETLMVLAQNTHLLPPSSLSDLARNFSWAWRSDRLGFR